MDMRRLAKAAVAMVAVLSLTSCSTSAGGTAAPTTATPSRATSPFHLFYSAQSMDPTAITAGPDGNLWFTDAASPDRIGQITPAGLIAEFTDPSLNNSRDITNGSDRALWFTNLGTKSVNTKGSIGRITPTGKISNFTGPYVEMPDSITGGPDGNLWFTDDLGVSRITPQWAIKFFSTAGLGSPTGDITKGPDGNLWWPALASGPATSSGSRRPG